MGTLRAAPARKSYDSKKGDPLEAALRKTPGRKPGPSHFFAESLPRSEVHVAIEVGLARLRHLRMHGRKLDFVRSPCRHRSRACPTSAPKNAWAETGLRQKSMSPPKSGLPDFGT